MSGSRSLIGAVCNVDGRAGVYRTPLRDPGGAPQPKLRSDPTRCAEWPRPRITFRILCSGGSHSPSFPGKKYRCDRGHPAYRLRSQMRPAGRIPQSRTPSWTDLPRWSYACPRTPPFESYPMTPHHVGIQMPFTRCTNVALVGVGTGGDWWREQPERWLVRLANHVPGLFCKACPPCVPCWRD